MKRTRLALALAALVALVVAMPAFGGPNVVGAAGKALGIAKKAEKRSKKAKKVARDAFARSGPGPQGPAGPAGEPGPVGPAGPVGPVGISDLEVVYEASEHDSDSPKHVTVDCPEGKVATGGGADLNGGKSGFSPAEISEVALERTVPLQNLEGYQASADEVTATGANWRVIAYATCASVTE